MKIDEVVNVLHASSMRSASHPPITPPSQPARPAEYRAFENAGIQAALRSAEGRPGSELSSWRTMADTISKVNAPLASVGAQEVEILPYAAFLELLRQRAEGKETSTTDIPGPAPSLMTVCIVTYPISGGGSAANDRAVSVDPSRSASSSLQQRQ